MLEKKKTIKDAKRLPFLGYKEGKEVEDGLSKKGEKGEVKERKEIEVKEVKETEEEEEGGGGTTGASAECLTGIELLETSDGEGQSVVDEAMKQIPREPIMMKQSASSSYSYRIAGPSMSRVRFNRMRGGGSFQLGKSSNKKGNDVNQGKEDLRDRFRKKQRKLYKKFLEEVSSLKEEFRNYVEEKETPLEHLIALRKDIQNYVNSPGEQMSEIRTEVKKYLDEQSVPKEILKDMYKSIRYYFEQLIEDPKEHIMSLKKEIQDLKSHISQEKLLNSAIPVPTYLSNSEAQTDITAPPCAPYVLCPSTLEITISTKDGKFEQNQFCEQQKPSLIDSACQAISDKKPGQMDYYCWQMDQGYPLGCQRPCEREVEPSEFSVGHKKRVCCRNGSEKKTQNHPDKSRQTSELDMKKNNHKCSCDPKWKEEKWRCGSLDRWVLPPPWWRPCFGSESYRDVQQRQFHSNLYRSKGVDSLASLGQSPRSPRDGKGSRDEDTKRKTECERGLLKEKMAKKDNGIKQLMEEKAVRDCPSGLISPKDDRSMFGATSQMTDTTLKAKGQETTLRERTRETKRRERHTVPSISTRTTSRNRSNFLVKQKKVAIQSGDGNTQGIQAVNLADEDYETFAGLGSDGRDSGRRREGESSQIERRGEIKKKSLDKGIDEGSTKEDNGSSECGRNESLTESKITVESLRGRRSGKRNKGGFPESRDRFCQRGRMRCKSTKESEIRNGDKYKSDWEDGLNDLGRKTWRSPIDKVRAWLDIGSSETSQKFKRSEKSNEIYNRKSSYPLNQRKKKLKFVKMFRQIFGRSKNLTRYSTKVNEMSSEGFQSLTDGKSRQRYHYTESMKKKRRENRRLAE